MTNLPANTSEYSRSHLALAQAVADLCPAELAEEIAVMGSVSRGVADEYSDIEFMMYTQKLATVDKYLSWMENIGFDNPRLRFAPREQIFDLTGRYKNVIFECSLVTWSQLETDVNSALDTVDDSHFMMTPWALTHAIPVKGGDRLQRYQAMFAEYPKRLQQFVIEFVLNRWTERMTNDDAGSGIGWKEARRGAWFGLIKRQYAWVSEITRLLFALNRQWEPEWKWLLPESDRLIQKPENFVERVNTIFSYPDPIQRVQVQLQLTLDTLDLLADSYDVDALKANIQHFQTAMMNPTHR